MSEASAPHPFLIRPAAAGDWQALRMLLPNAVHHNCGCEMAVAVEAKTGFAIGAVALSPLMRTKPHPGPRVALHVVPPWRRRGVGRQLLRWADRAAGRRGAQALYAWSSLEADSQLEKIWKYLGFNQSQSHPLTEVDAAKTVSHLQQIFDRIQRKRPIPELARIVPLGAVDPAQVIRLHLEYLGGNEALILDRLRGSAPERFDLHLSQTLLMNQQVQGLALVRRISANSIFIEGNVLHPTLRKGWANLWLKFESAKVCLAAGISTFVYETFAQHADSLKFSRRVDGFILPRIEPYRLIQLLPAAV